MNSEYELYFVAFLNNQNKNVIIPYFWCDDIDWAKTINNGLNRNENHLIFYSPDIEKDPDFTLTTRSTFDSNSDGCYFGKLKRSFSKKNYIINKSFDDTPI